MRLLRVESPWCEASLVSGIALPTGLLAAFFTGEWRPGDYEQLLFFSPLVGCLAVSPQDLGGLVTHVLVGVRDVSTSNTSCCLRRAVSG